mmetsp:Transcript_17045/g.23860  ORF Transcript_17045/g.23860 Transcript_17045/m.23860 type:complete len:216 (+) Transcript_17045:283-930(+)
MQTVAKKETDIRAIFGTSTSPKSLRKSAGVFTRTSTRMMFKRGTKGWAGLNGRKPRNRNNKDAYSPSRRNQSNNNSSPSTTLKSKTECFFDDDDLPNLRYSTTTVKKKMPKLPVKKKTPLNCTRVSTLANFDEREAERERIRSLYFGEGESEITDIFNPWVIAHGRQQVKKRMVTSHKGQSKIKKNDTYSEEFDYCLGSLAGKAEAAWRKRMFQS